MKREAVTTEAMRAALADVGQVYGQFKPLKWRELMGLLLHLAAMRDREFVLEIYGGVCSA